MSDLVTKMQIPNR